MIMSNIRWILFARVLVFKTGTGINPYVGTLNPTLIPDSLPHKRGSSSNVI